MALRHKFQFQDGLRSKVMSTACTYWIMTNSEKLLLQEPLERVPKQKMYMGILATKHHQAHLSIHANVLLHHQYVCTRSHLLFLPRIHCAKPFPSPDMSPRNLSPQ